LPESAAAMVGRADGGDRRQSATQKTLVAEGMPDIGPGARRYIAKPVITSGSGPTSVPLVASHCFSEPTGRNNLGTETERTRRDPVVVPSPQTRNRRAGSHAPSRRLATTLLLPRTPGAVASPGIG
jgi:hypothetical protein